MKKIILYILLACIAIGCIFFFCRPKKVIRVGVENAYRPWCYLDEKTGDLAGSDVDIVTEICKRLNYDFKFVCIDWSQKQALLYGHKIDMVTSMFTITDREKDYACIQPLANNDLVAIVSKSSGINELSDLAHKTVLVQDSTSSHDVLKEGGSEYELGKTFKTLIAIEGVEQCFLILLHGAVDAFVVDEDIAKFFVSKHSDTFRYLEKPIHHEHVGFGFRQSDTSLRDKFDSIINDMRQDGTMSEISQKHFGRSDRFDIRKKETP